MTAVTGDVRGCDSPVKTSPALQHFGRELKLAREALGLTQEQLAQAINFSKSYVAMIETGQRPPKRDFTIPVDNVLKTDGRFDRMRSDLLVAEARPEWFRPWVDYESEANEIRWYEPLLVPGLLQTEEYARALIEDGSPEQAESLISQRLERQLVLENARVIALVDESVVRRLVGAPETMCRQLIQLTEAQAVVQVLPEGAQTYRHLEGPFALAAVDGAEIAYVDTPARGFVLDSPEVVSRLRQRWEIIRAEALPIRQSRELILKVADQWR